MWTGSSPANGPDNAAGTGVVGVFGDHGSAFVANLDEPVPGVPHQMKVLVPVSVGPGRQAQGVAGAVVEDAGIAAVDLHHLVVPVVDAGLVEGFDAVLLRRVALPVAVGS